MFHTMGRIRDVETALSAQKVRDRYGGEMFVVDQPWLDANRGNHANNNSFQVDLDHACIEPIAEGLVIVACGSAALKTYQNAGHLPKNIGVEKCRGAYRPFKGGLLTASYAPDIAFPDFVSGFKADAMVAARVAQTGQINAKLPVEPKLVKSVQSIIDSIDNFPELGRCTLSLDLETMGLDPYKTGAQIVCVSITWKRLAEDTPECLVIYTYGLTGLRLKLLIDGLQYLLTHPNVYTIGANLKYDLAWLAYHWEIECTNFGFDTLLGGSLVDENRWNGLNQHAKIYTEFGGYDDWFDQSYDKGHMETVPIPDLVQYAGGDTQACFYSARQIVEELDEVSKGPNGNILKRTPLTFYQKVLHPAARAFEKVEQRGMYVDRGAFDAFGKWAVEERADLEVQLSAQIPQATKTKFEDWQSFKPAVIVHYLFDVLGLEPKQMTGKSGKPSTAWSHLQSFQDHPVCGEFVKGLKELNALKKLHSTYYVGFLEHLRDDGLFHPTYWLHRAGHGDEGGAVTGRSSVTDPAIQTIPKHTEVAKKLRKCFPAPPGYIVAGLDYSQGELRIVACVAGETNMIAAYKKGLDLHAVTASGMKGMTLSDFNALKATDYVQFEFLRRNGKAGNFGLVYGMSADGYVDYAWNLYGVELTQQEAQTQRNNFFKQYPQLLNYHDSQTADVKRQGWVISPLGRVRHLPHIWSSDQYQSGKARRQAINSPIQSTLSDMSFWSTAELQLHFPEIWCWGMIHDQNLFYLREDRWQEEAAQVQQTMENLPFEEYFGWTPALNFPVDLQVGPTLGDLVDADDFNG